MSAAPLRVCYVLDGTSLCGGVKVVLHQANLLAARGHSVVVAGCGEAPAWFPLAAEYRRLERLAPESLPAADVTVATYWTTIAAVADAPRAGQALHYCQGFEASFDHNRADHPAILQAYARPIPAIAVAPHLVELLRERFGRPARVVTPPLDRSWRPRLRRSPHRPPRVLVAHPFEISWKGVRTALLAVRELREGGLPCRLVRLSQWPLGEEERALLGPDEFHCDIPPSAVPALLRTCDVLLAPSGEAEGFGLPVVEAMACGVPVVASDIEAFRFTTAGAAALAPPDDPAAFAAAARELLGSAERWREARRRGLGSVRRFGEDSVATELEDALLWAAGGRWRGGGRAAGTAR